MHDQKAGVRYMIILPLRAAGAVWSIKCPAAGQPRFAAVAPAHVAC